MGPTHPQIGEVAGRTGLSMRILRSHDEVDPVAPATIAQGRSRLPAEDRRANQRSPLGSVQGSTARRRREIRRQARMVGAWS